MVDTERWMFSVFLSNLLLFNGYWKVILKWKLFTSCKGLCGITSKNCRNWEVDTTVLKKHLWCNTNFGFIMRVVTWCESRLLDGREGAGYSYSGPKLCTSCSKILATGWQIHHYRQSFCPLGVWCHFLSGCLIRCSFWGCGERGCVWWKGGRQSPEPEADPFPDTDI